MRFRSFVALLLLAALATGARAQAPAFSLEGKVIRFLVGQAAGGVTDLEARLIAEHMAPYLPGHPTIVVQDITGAGGLRMLTYFAGLDPVAELAVAVIPSSAPFRARAGGLAAPFDPRAVAWVGSFADSTNICIVGSGTNIATVDDMRGRELTMGLLTAGGYQNALRLMLNRALGIQYTPVIGYDSLATLALAVRRGEIDAFCSPYSSYPTLVEPMIADGAARIVFYLGPERRDDIAAPYLFDLPMDAEAEAFLRTGIASISFGRPLGIAAGAPPDFVDAMRAAFEAAMADPGFLAAAEAMGIDVRPVPAASIAAAVDRLYATPDAIIAEFDTFLFAE